MASAINNVSLTDGTILVTIGVTTKGKSMRNKFKTSTIPKTDTGGVSGTTTILNTRQIVKKFNVSGHLATGLAVGDSSHNAQDKDVDMENMFQSGKILSMTWTDGTVHGVMLEDYFSEHETADGFSAADGETEYTIRFTAVQGTALV